MLATWEIRSPKGGSGRKCHSWMSVTVGKENDVEFSLSQAEQNECFDKIRCQSTTKALLLVRASTPYNKLPTRNAATSPSAVR